MYTYIPASDIISITFKQYRSSCENFRSKCYFLQIIGYLPKIIFRKQRTRRRETMETFGIKFTQLKVVLERNLEMLAAAAIIWGTLLLIMMGYPLAIYLFFYSETSRYCMLLYFIWMYYDNHLHPIGGRR